MRIIKLSFIVLVIAVVATITGCQSQVTPEVPCSIEVTSPGLWESIDGNGEYEINWDWSGPTNKEVNIILIGYTEDEVELGTMSISSNVLGADESYLWGPNFGADILDSFPEDWPWWFKVKIEVIGEEIEAFSEVFSIQSSEVFDFGGFYFL